MNDQPAGTLWYHDHALGITRLNVYAGMAGFYILRDEQDTGKADNPLKLPSGKYEAALAIQDRMFKEDGKFFYPAFEGDPFYDEFIVGEGANPPPGASALAEFFGDFMVVNGKIWPKMDVEPRKYRLRLLNGCDSRFLAIRFLVATSDTDATGEDLIQFTVIGSDQSLGKATTKTTLLSEPGSRYDIIFDFAGLQGQRIIMKNIGGDEPFGGDLPGPQIYNYTDRIMAFDVEDIPTPTDDPEPLLDMVTNWPDEELKEESPVTLIRKVALFEGRDEYGRLQPLLGTIGPHYYAGTDDIIEWPDEHVYQDANLTGTMEGTIAWHTPATENPELDTVEEWEIWNLSGDAHPIHLHLVHFNVLSREEFMYDTNTNETSEDFDGTLKLPEVNPMPAGNGVYLVRQALVEHNSAKTGEFGQGYRVVIPDGVNVIRGSVDQPDEYFEESNKDMVVALPGQVTRIRAKFDKPGRYAW